MFFLRNIFIILRDNYLFRRSRILSDKKKLDNKLLLLYDWLDLPKIKPKKEN